MYYTGQSDIVLGTDVANRPSVQTEALIGFFVNLLVLRTDLSGDPSFKGLLRRVRSVALGAYAHQDVVFDKLVEELRPERSLSHNPLVQALFVQQNTPGSTSAMPGLELSQFKLAVPSKFDMAVFVSETEKGMDCSWLFNPDLFETTTIIRMANLYQILMEKVTAGAELKLSTLMQFLSEAEQQSRIAEHAQYEELSLQRLKKITRKAAVAI
jgi:non-ribosomal peptide synthetase component F